MRVLNVNGTSGRTCKCGSWLDHWRKFSGQSLIYCPVEGCYEIAAVGAHVQIGGGSDQSWYIVPLCAGHNAARGKSVLIGDGVGLVPANVNDTCGS